MGKRRNHRWQNKPIRAEDRALWVCVYCGAESEAEACKTNPGSWPMRDTFYRESADSQWRVVERIPDCPDTIRVPMSVRSIVLGDREIQDIAAQLGVPPGTVNSWRTCMRRVARGLAPKMTEEEREARESSLKAARYRDEEDGPKMAWSTVARLLKVTPYKAKAALIAAGIPDLPVSRNELLGALAELYKRKAAHSGFRASQVYERWAR